MARRGENIYFRKDGRYEGRYIRGRDNQGKPLFGYVYGKRYGDVKEKLVKKKAEIGTLPLPDRKNKWGDGSAVQWLMHWLECIARPEVKKSTYTIYKGILNRHLIPFFGQEGLWYLHNERILQLIQVLQGKALSTSTIQGVLRLLYAAREAAYHEGYRAEMPSRKHKRLHTTPKKARYLTQKEQKIVESEAIKRKQLEIVFSLYTGLRLGEICALRWSDIDLKEGCVVVSHTLQRLAHNQGSSKTELFISSPKSNCGQRYIPLISMLKEQVKNVFLEKRPRPDDFVFGRGNRPADPRSLQYRIQRLASDLGLYGVHFHTLRHTFATRCMESGIGVETIRDLMGHSTSRITLDFYGHSTCDHKRVVMERLLAEAV